MQENNVKLHGMVGLKKSQLKFLLKRKSDYLIIKVSGLPSKVQYSFCFGEPKLCGAFTYKTDMFARRFALVAILVDRLVKNGIIV